MAEPDLTPSPARLVESLRDTGYSYEAAFADIVDNSIAASAKKIEIDIHTSPIDSELCVAFYDNGDGMNETELINAMRYGSEKRESPKSLGKFGMGLKTASTAFCRRLTVISKKDDELCLKTWDLDKIIELDKWILLSPNVGEFVDEIDKLGKLTKGANGTAVIWENVDRLTKSSGQNLADQALKTVIDEVSKHLGAIFGKFINVANDDPENGNPIEGIQVFVNGNPIEGWDPTGQFMNIHGAEKRVLIKRFPNIQVDLGDGLTQKKEEFELNAILLPNKNAMTDDELQKVRYGNDNQGFYIYRENRLIYAGGWPHRLYTKDPHLNLFRVELNFNHELDEYFQIDIRKTRVILPQALREIIRKQLGPIRNEANKRYRQGTKTTSANANGEKDEHANSSIALNRSSEKNQKATATILDHEKGTAEIRNQFGTTVLERTKLLEGTEVTVSTEPTLDDGLLWTYALNQDGEVCVVLNTGHQFYEKFYKSDKINPMLVQAMDSVFWSLANAEISTISDKAKRNIEELRFTVSRNLRNLADELPDVR